MKTYSWIDELFDEYPVKTKDGRAIRTPAQIKRMQAIYADIDDEVMLQAVYAYIKVGKFFPTTADLNPHVEAAIEDSRGTHIADEGNIIYGAYSDDELFEFEDSRGWYCCEECNRDREPTAIAF